MGRRPPPVAGEPVAPRPAATVVLLRPSAAGLEVLLTRRPSTMAFAAGMMVFPGGRVDSADSDPRLAARSSLSPEEAAARLGGATEPELAAALHVAAVRELFEEAGVLVADGVSQTADLSELRVELLDGRLAFADLAERLDLRLRPDRLVPIARWVTPAAYPRRFDARFFAAELPAGANPTFIGDEVADHRWATPRAALDAMAAHEIEMWIPTSSTLQRLVDIATIDDVAERLVVGPIRSSSIERDGDVVLLTSWTAGGVPGRPVETRLVGRGDVVVVDPGDPSPEALVAILAAVDDAGARIVGIVITTPDPAWAAGADELSERTGAPVFGPRGSARWLPFPVVERVSLPDDLRGFRAWVDLGDEPT
jgi:endoribonuclease LACTB2